MSLWRKSDIPFDIFWKQYYPENHPPYALVSEDYFDNHLDMYVGDIHKVTLDDLLGLSEEELNCVPTYWLYHWTWCHAECDNELSPMDLFNAVNSKREKYKVIGIGLLREVHTFLKLHRQFSANEMQMILGISYEKFLKVTYWLIVNGKVQYRGNQYYVVG